jgi:hypothetical protein
MDRRLTPLLLVALLLVTACILPPEGRYEQSTEPPSKIAEFTATHTLTQSILIDGEKMGYLFTYNEVPVETGEPQLAPPGTAFIKNLDFQNIGFMDPYGKTFRFLENNRTEAVCQSTTEKNLATFFGLPEATIELQDI